MEPLAGARASSTDEGIPGVKVSKQIATRIRSEERECLDHLIVLGEAHLRWKRRGGPKFFPLTSKNRESHAKMCNIIVIFCSFRRFSKSTAIATDRQSMHQRSLVARGRMVPAC
jgi:hypothetical protein